ncbi:hypothetical protein SAMN05216371_0188 [Streptomyces sp. TLI_053]|uniref:hypothetical protein n=1 Tax=Streptomyces sp. TLI_053 TaxID=1855352 RepID=UPI00087BC462|nr:hypothetical protein [Streptomyces sp. TLI_053]SDS57360.1 hypothetical protein SAMN05216371_0188 [Streptomyces sp. TLI_053]
MRKLKTAAAALIASGTLLLAAPGVASATEVHQYLGNLENLGASGDKWKSTVNATGRYNTSCTSVSGYAGANGWDPNGWFSSIRRAKDQSGAFWSSDHYSSGRYCIENKDLLSWGEYYTRVTAKHTTALAGISVDHYAW